MGKCLFNLNLKSIFVYFFFFSQGLVFSSNQEIIDTLDKLHTTIKEISEKKIDKNNINYVDRDCFKYLRYKKNVKNNTWKILV